MAIKRYTMGPGTLTLGEHGDIAAQVTAMRVEWSVNESSSDDTPVLSGEVLQGEADVTYAATLAGNVVQDLDAAGLVEFTWTNKGVNVPFVFVPSTDKGRQVTGTVRVDPITLGGDVRDKAPRSDLSWRCIGDPDLGNVTP